MTPVGKRLLTLPDAAEDRPEVGAEVVGTDEEAPFFRPRSEITKT